TLLLVVIALINRPVLTLTQERVEPSVLAVMVDRSVSMRVRDAGQDGVSRLQAVERLLDGNDRALLKELTKQHELRVYEFDDQPRFLEAVGKNGVETANALPSIKAEGQTTQVVQSVRGV